MTKQRKRRLVAAAVAASCLAALVLGWLFIPWFDSQPLDLAWSDMRKTHPDLGLPSTAGLRARSLLHVFSRSFSIPLDEQCELLVFRLEHWSKYRGNYSRWYLYREPLYQAEYIEAAKKSGKPLSPTDYCRHYLSQEVRRQSHAQHFVVIDELNTLWPPEAGKLDDGNYMMIMGHSAVAGLSLKVIVDPKGNLVKYEWPFSSM
jgi:hypothetical protein